MATIAGETMTRIRRLAQKAKNMGYTHIHSVVKSVYNTTYYHVNRIDSIIESGRWIPAYMGQWQGRKGTWYGRIGVNSLPEKSISKKELYRLESK